MNLSSKASSWSRHSLHRTLYVPAQFLLTNTCSAWMKLIGLFTNPLLFSTLTSRQRSLFEMRASRKLPRESCFAFSSPLPDVESISAHFECTTILLGIYIFLKLTHMLLFVGDSVIWLSWDCLSPMSFLFNHIQRVTRNGQLRFFLPVRFLVYLLL